MPSYKQDYPERWLKAEHLQGRAVVATISRVDRIEIFNRQTNKKEPRYAASFAGKEKQLLLNKTGLQSLEEITGTDQFDQWRDVRVILRAQSTRLGDTITLSQAQQAQAQVHGANTPLAPQERVHGQREALPVGAWPGDAPESTAPAPQSTAPQSTVGVHGPGLEADEDFSWQDGPEEEEEVPGPHYDKSHTTRLDTGREVEVSQEAFFSISDLIHKVKSLEQSSNGPMTDQQHAFVVHGLKKWSNREGELILSTLLGKTVDTNHHAGEAVGRYLYELFKENGELPLETQALAMFVKDYLPKKQA